MAKGLQSIKYFLLQYPRVEKIGKKPIFLKFFSIFFVSGKSHSAKKVKGDPLGVFGHPFICKIEKKMKGKPFGDKTNLRKKVSTPKNTCTKKFLVMGGTRTRPSAWQTSKNPPKNRSRKNYISVAVSGSQLIELIKSVTSLVLKKEKLLL